MQRIDGEWRFVEPKSAKSRRQVALGEMVSEALRRHRAKQVEDRLKTGGAWHDMDLVFSNELGRPVEVSNLTYRYFRPLLMKAGLPQVRFHDLRHTAATLMLGAEVDVKLVSEMLGHSQTAFTMDRYQHVALEMQKQADEETTVRCDPIAMNARLAKSRWSPYSPRRSVGSVERGS